MSKLYATATSEKASKGQGGKEYIDIDLSIDDHGSYKTIIALTFRDNDESYILVDEHDNVLKRIIKAGIIDCGCKKNEFSCLKHSKAKGEQQKGAI